MIPTALCSPCYGELALQGRARLFCVTLIRQGDLCHGRRLAGVTLLRHAAASRCCVTLQGACRRRLLRHAAGGALLRHAAGGACRRHAGRRHAAASRAAPAASRCCVTLAGVTQLTSRCRRDAAASRCCVDAAGGACVDAWQA